jgi:hypothetical protein
VKSRHWIWLLAVAALLAPMLALAEDPPMPMPRPTDRLPSAEDVTDGDGESGSKATPVAPDASPASPDVVPATPDAATSAAAAAAAALASEPQPVTLTARITDKGQDIQSGLVWRVFAAKADASGELPLAAKSQQGIARITLAPGQYVVHVAYGRAQTTDTLTVAKGDNTKDLVLDAGAIRLNAAVTGDISIPVNLLHFDIFAPGSEDDRTMIAQNIGPGDIVTLNAGTYHVVSYFGAVNAVVRADLRVEPGQLTEATLYHRAAPVSFKLVSEAGGEAIADIDWTVKTADGQSVFTNTGAFPTTVLAEGDYLVLAKRGDKVYSREFQIAPGAAREIEVLTSVY